MSKGKWPSSPAGELVESFLHSYAPGTPLRTSHVRRYLAEHDIDLASSSISNQLACAARAGLIHQDPTGTHWICSNIEQTEKRLAVAGIAPSAAQAVPATQAIACPSRPPRPNEFNALQVGTSVIAYVEKLRRELAKLRECVEDYERVVDENRAMRERIAELSERLNGVQVGRLTLPNLGKE